MLSELEQAQLEEFTKDVATPPRFIELAKERDKILDVILFSPIEQWKEAFDEVAMRGVKAAMENLKYIHESKGEHNKEVANQQQETVDKILKSKIRWAAFIGMLESVRQANADFEVIEPK